MAYIYPKRISFDVPEGDYRAVTVESFERKTGTLRIVFAITSLQDPHHVYKCGKDYKAGDPRVAEDLEQWLGMKKVRTLIKSDGSLDLLKLKGLEADIRVEHIHNDEYDQPYVYVSRIEAPGTLVTGFASAR